jgi:hypothetical protein
MGSVDIFPLVRGLLIVIGISIALGQYGQLEAWARKEAVHAMQPNAWPELRFFPPNYGTRRGIDRHSVIHYNQ